MQIRSEHRDENKRLSEQVAAAAPAPLGWMLVIYVGDPAT